MKPLPVSPVYTHELRNVAAEKSDQKENRKGFIRWEKRFIQSGMIDISMKTADKGADFRYNGVSTMKGKYAA